MLLVVEGPNKSGKTTLIKEVIHLAETTQITNSSPMLWPITVINWPRKQFGEGTSYPHEQVTEMAYRLLTYLDLEHRHFIVDRAWPTDMIYNKVLNRVRYDYQYCRAPREDFRGHVGIVFLPASSDILLDRSRRDADLEIWESNIQEKLYMAYYEFFAIYDGTYTETLKPAKTVEENAREVIDVLLAFQEI
jgi:thymidylate kinase